MKLTDAHKKIISRFFEIERENGWVDYEKLKNACKMRGQFGVKLGELERAQILKVDINYDTKRVAVECIDEIISLEYEPKLDWQPVEISNEEIFRMDMERKKEHIAKKA